MIDKLKQKIINISSDNKSIITLIGGTTFAQFLNFLFSPIATRLFSPEVFGDLSVFTSITSIIGIVVCLRYELAIVLPEEDDEGFYILKLCCIISLVISVLTGLIFLFEGQKIYAKLGATNLANYWYYVPVNMFLTGIIYAANIWLTRTRQFKVLSLNKVAPVLAINIVSIGLGFLGYRDIGVRLFSIFVSNIVNLVVITNVILPEFSSKKNRTKYNYKTLVVKYKRFLIYDIWSALLNNLSWMIVPILMNYYYSSNAAGQYSIGMRVIQIPASVIGASISQVFMKTANERKYSRSLYPYCKKMALVLLKYTGTLAIILLFFGKPLFHFVFGAKWDMAGVYTQILAPWAIFWFVASPLSAIYTISQKQNISLITSALNLATRFLSLYLGKKLGSDIIGLVFFSISGIVINLLSIFFCLRIAWNNDNLF